MRDSDLLDKLNQIQADQVTLRSRYKDARRNMAAFGGRGYPSSSMPDSSIGTSRGVSDPVALEVQRGRQDRARQNGLELEAAIVEAAGALARAVRIAKAYTETIDQDKADEGCKWCASVDRFTLAWKDELCRWHYDFRADFGCEPARQLSIDHLDGKRISVNEIRRYHPELGARAS